MALKRYEKYPGRWAPATPEQPQGAFKNRTTTVSKDGSFIEKDWINDFAGFFSAALNKAAIVPNGQVDTALQSQYYEAFRTFFYNPENKPSLAALGAAAATHVHTIANVTGLQSALDSKSPVGHKHNISDVNSLQASLDDRYTKAEMLGKCVGIYVNLGTADINTLSQNADAGVYRQGNSVDAALDRGYPEKAAGTLIVYAGADVTQEYRVYNSSRIYTRGKYSSGNWTPWARQYNTENKPTANEINTYTKEFFNGKLIGIPKSLGAENLNSVTVAGVYYQRSVSGATLALNYPTTRSGALIVYLASDDICIQEYRTYVDSLIYSRSQKSSGEWSEWARQYNTLYKPSAADTGAAPANSVLGAGQSWQDVTTGRKSNTSYTNSTGRPIYIYAQTPTLTATVTVEIIVDDVRADLYASQDSSSKHGTVRAIVPAGSVYKVVTSQALSLWTELR